MLEKIKLVIWDMDNTFWRGTISEGDIISDERNCKLVKELTDRGIVNSICSKNDYDIVWDRLVQLGVSQYFVFPSINWSAKAARLKQTIDKMGLRPDNVLFIDDEPANLAEAQFLMPNIMVGNEQVLNQLREEIIYVSKSDTEHKRLKQYKILEKRESLKKETATTDDFLRQSNIQLEIDSDWQSNLSRIAEMVARTNQLNYTKKRDTEKELEQLLQQDDVISGCVRVRDRFGDYGIVGFFAVKNNSCVHFLFSCRTIGMGIESFIYHYLGCPEIEIQGDVVTNLSQDCPDWITWIDTTSNESSQERMKLKTKILFKGPCDMDAIFAFIQESKDIDCEFTYVKPENGIVIESGNSTVQMLETMRLSAEEKQEVVDELPFADMGMYSDRMFSGDYQVVVISILHDANLGLYQRKETGQIVAFGQSYYPLTDERNWKALCERKIYTANAEFTEEFLRWFSDKYEFIGGCTPEQTIDNIQRIKEMVGSNTHLVVLLGTETEYEGATEAWKGKNLFYQAVNRGIKDLAQRENMLHYIDINRYIKGQESFFHHYNHFVVSVYYEMARDLVALVNECSGVEISDKHWTYVVTRWIKQKIRILLKWRI